MHFLGRKPGRGGGNHTGPLYDPPFRIYSPEFSTQLPQTDASHSATIVLHSTHCAASCWLFQVEQGGGYQKPRGPPSRSFLKAWSVAQYFFDVRNNGTLVVDEVGLDLDDLMAAVREAASALAEMADDMVMGSLSQQLTIEIREALGIAPLKVTLALELVGPIVPIVSMRPS
jgi:hypothetical protein